MRVFLEFIRRHSYEPFFYLQRRLAPGESGTVRNAKYVCIDRNGRFAKCRIQDDVGGLSSNPGKCFEFRSRARNLAVVFFDQETARVDDIFSFAVIQTNGSNVRFQTVDAEREDSFGCAGDRIQFAGSLVDADIRRLRRKNHTDKQLERISVVELSRRSRHTLAKNVVDRRALLGIHERSYRFSGRAPREMEV